MVLVVGTASLIHDHHALAVVLVPTIAVLVLIASAIWGAKARLREGEVATRRLAAPVLRPTSQSVPPTPNLEVSNTSPL